MARINRDEPLLSMDEWWAKMGKSKQKRGDELSLDPDNSVLGSSAMCDHGVKPSSQEWLQIKPALMELLINSYDSGAQMFVQDSAYDQLNIRLHKEVTVRGEFRISSAANNKPTACESFWVLVEFADDVRGTFMQPGKVQRYVRLQLPDFDDGRPRFLRAALCTFWERLPEWDDRDIGGPVYRFWHDEKYITDQCYAVSLDGIVGPMLHTHENIAINKKNPQRCDHYLLAAYSFLAGVKR